MDSLSAIILSCKWQCIAFQIAIDQKRGEMFHRVLSQNGLKHVQNIFYIFLHGALSNLGAVGFGL